MKSKEITQKPRPRRRSRQSAALSGLGAAQGRASHLGRIVRHRPSRGHAQSCMRLLGALFIQPNAGRFWPPPARLPRPRPSYPQYLSLSKNGRRPRDERRPSRQFLFFQPSGESARSPSCNRLTRTGRLTSPKTGLTTRRNKPSHAQCLVHGCIGILAARTSGRRRGFFAPSAKCHPTFVGLSIGCARKDVHA